MNSAFADTSATKHREGLPNFFSMADQAFATDRLHQSWYKAQNDHRDSWPSNSVFHRHLHPAIDASS
jgi:hypothetical protein